MTYHELAAHQPTVCRAVGTLLLLLLMLAPAMALDGALNIHDPSTVISCDGRYYVFGTGRGVSVLTSDDGFTWQRGGRIFDRVPDSVHQYCPMNDGAGVWAPDIIKVHGQYYLYYAISSWGQFVSAVGLMTSPTLDPKSPAYKWTDRGMVVHSVQGEDLNAIDPGVIQAPDGTLWISYGSYHGTIQLVQLDPKTGLRIAPNSPVSIISSRSEASDIMYHAGYYYLFVNHGSCCQGAKSTYNIRVGRSRKVTGPYLDDKGEDMAKGGGRLFAGPTATLIGPGHFGLLEDNGVQKFSCHYEADLSHGGRSVLAIQPLLWSADGWPMPGTDLADGTSYQIRAQPSGTALETASAGAAPRLARAAPQDNQKWTVAAAGGGLYRIVSTATGSALTLPAATGIATGPYTGADSQLWRIDETPDGKYRIEAKASRLALTMQKGDAVAAAPYSGAESQRWEIAGL